MFRNFSFEAASRHPSVLDLDAERAYMNVSPTSMPCSPPPAQTRPPTPPTVTMGDLAQKFSQQNLRVEVDQTYQGTSYNEPLTPPNDEIAFGDDATQDSEQPSYAYLSTTSIRLQRQANMRWQCNPAHVKDLTLLVEKMVDNGEQCLICTRPEPRSAHSENSSDMEEDEGVDMRRSSTPELPSFNLKYRRSGDRLHGQACVSKTVRMRKKKQRREPSKK